MIYMQVEGGEHHQRTWGFILPYFLRWTFPTRSNLQQHPIDGRDFIVVQTKGREVSYPRTAARRHRAPSAPSAQSVRLLRMVAKKSRIAKRGSKP
jgi:hypothetical protein